MKEREDLTHRKKKLFLDPELGCRYPLPAPECVAWRQHSKALCAVCQEHDHDLLLYYNVCKSKFRFYLQLCVLCPCV